MNIIINGITTEVIDLTCDMTIGQIKLFLSKKINLSNYNIKFIFNNEKEISPIIWETNKYDTTDFTKYKSLLKGCKIKLTSLGVVETKLVPGTINLKPKQNPVKNPNQQIVTLIAKPKEIIPIAKLPKYIPNTNGVPRRIRKRNNKKYNKKSKTDTTNIDNKNRSYLLTNIFKSLVPLDHERIHDLGKYERYIELFPTYQKFKEEQSKYVNKLSSKRLGYLTTLMKDLQIQKGFIPTTIEYMIFGGTPSMAPDGFFLIYGMVVMVSGL